ncbi:MULTISPECIES: hypothetical protein [unclassified Cupriavidus]|uniref:hypothetical protein n=1 Tax=unclassified Cupriavidus TaxID=2640874 RepID=UPI001C0087C8|nr:MULTISPECIES: hypothetical protein [unclassified Cupriavidus]MCA3184475.1 hypothetical protein [Cupriavidus sp.]MCA3192695.1 hypothetical protein [Cupriavidus sp.]MCA3194896.1 hypothetical protein [Cupriavidus sp.]MCA3200534.1 hypothetical protein [Cupriavidus sp.]MCA3207812.1 hypothetical protein [Cupriavidus sp.]
MLMLLWRASPAPGGDVVCKGPTLARGCGPRIGPAAIRDAGGNGIGAIVCTA